MEHNFSLIKSYQYTTEASIYSGKLESEGIEVFLRDNHIIDSNPLYSNAVGGVKLYVKKEDEQKAISVLSQISEFSLDDYNQLMKCPKCGAKEIEMYTSIKDFKSLIAFIFSIIIVLIPFYSRYKYKCQQCNFEFK